MVTTRRQRVVCCLYEGFSTLDVTLLTTVLSAAGQRWNHRPFEISLGALSVGAVDGRPYPLLATTALADVRETDIVFIPGGDADRAIQDPRLPAEIERLAAIADKLCAAGNGQLILARASLLPASATAADGELALALEKVLHAEATARDFHHDGRLFIAAHSLGVLALALELVRGSLGRSEADAVATALGQRQRALLLGIKP